MGVYEGEMLDLDTQQGRYGEHLAQLVVTSAGYSCYKPDDTTGDGVDLVITHTQQDGQTARPPNVELQIKTVRRPRIVDGKISYDLEVKHYDALRTPGGTRRYLVVVLVPGPHPADWYALGRDFIAFWKSAYWRDLLGEPATTNTSKVAVHVPLANRYTQQTVHAHMAEARSAFLSQFGGT
jgi:hypothetical protein